MNESFAIEVSNGEQVRGSIFDTGKGAVGVFVHGLLSSAAGEKSTSLWEYAKCQKRSWVKFDQRGQGESDGSHHENRVSRVYADLQHVLEFIGHDRPKCLVGSNLGGWVSACIAKREEFNVQGMLLLAPAFNFVEKIYQSLAPAEQEIWRTTGRYTLPTPYDSDGFSLAYQVVEDARQFNAFANPVDYPFPVTILHGENDEVVPLALSREFVQHVSSNVDLKVIADGDHRLTSEIQTIIEVVDNNWPKE